MLPSGLSRSSVEHLRRDGLSQPDPRRIKSRMEVRNPSGGMREGGHANIRMDVLTRELQAYRATLMLHGGTWANISTFLCQQMKRDQHMSHRSLRVTSSIQLQQRRPNVSTSLASPNSMLLFLRKFVLFSQTGPGSSSRSSNLALLSQEI